MSTANTADELFIRSLVVVWSRVSWWSGSESRGGLVQSLVVVWFRVSWWSGSESRGGPVQCLVEQNEERAALLDFGDEFFL
ncbi:hypothetical protein EYF80_041106 [Liparis tanakae]|uniref:Uncharacterized protein n=1 Tax=Liparis tanakae TaxID=230148 RepID=A0A4Z2G560_9TELE|nr:hypothetical protein EYF80_041106 [Liparis tanakae]